MYMSFLINNKGDFLMKNLNEYNKICSLLKSITKMDVRLFNENGDLLLQFIDHTIPVALQNVDSGYDINATLKNNSTNSFYYYINPFGLEYIASGIWDDKSLRGSIIIGPFLSSIPNTFFISDIIAKNKLPVSERKQLQEFYTSLSVISSNDSNSMGDLLVNMCGHKHIDSQLITSDIIQPVLNREQIQTKIEETKDIIEHRYIFEKKLMNAITKGDKKQIDHISNEINSVLNISDRFPESPIRSAKNLSLVLNTLCRIATERAGVHPTYIHNISERFAILIERAPNLPHLKKLNMVIIHDYCNLVSVFSTRNYSSIVQKAVHYIHLNLENPLTLKEIAATLNVSPSHLSRKFKSETNKNIIDFINQKRIEEAKLYLQSEPISITDIAFLVGFNDINYFSRVFKKWTSLTPSQYIKSKHELE